MLSSHKTAYSFPCFGNRWNKLYCGSLSLGVNKAFSFPLVKLVFNLELLGTLNPHCTNKLEINGIEKLIRQFLYNERNKGVLLSHSHFYQLILFFNKIKYLHSKIVLYIIFSVLRTCPHSNESYGLAYLQSKLLFPKQAFRKTS